MEFLIGMILAILAVEVIHRLAPTWPIPGTEAFAYKGIFGFSPSHPGDSGEPEERFVRTVLGSRGNKLQLLQIDLEQAERTYNQSTTVAAMTKNRRELRKVQKTCYRAEAKLQKAIDLAAMFNGNEVLEGTNLPGYTPSEKSLIKYRRLVGIA